MHPVLLLSLTAILVSPSASVAPPGPASAQEAPLVFLGGCEPTTHSGWLWECTFVVEVHDASLIYFRWDFDGDGSWDTGSPASGGWIADTMVHHGYGSDGVRHVCVQGWDGITTRSVNGRWEPVGPTVCRTYALSMDMGFTPPSWDRGSTGRVTLILYVPHDFAPPIPRARSAVIVGHGPGGVPAMVGHVFRLPGSEPTVMYFSADRAALTAYLGPGRHVAILWAEWSDLVAVAEGASDVTIL